MIDLGLSKLALIGVVALVVIGPERLPKVARMAGTLYGRAQRYLHEVKSEVTREIELEELRNLQKEVHETAQQFKSDVENTIAEQVGDVNAAWHDRVHSPRAPATLGDLERKAREFRRKKLVRNSAIPGWYKARHGGKAHIMSGAARVKKFRPGSSSKASFF
ncbi:MAG: Sec-independent protein translocase protein TatB [Telluria sp.]